MGTNDDIVKKNIRSVNDAQEKVVALSLIRSERGEYLLAWALTIAIKALNGKEEIGHPFPDGSNLDAKDMELLLNHIFYDQKANIP